MLTRRQHYLAALRARRFTRAELRGYLRSLDPHRPHGTSRLRRGDLEEAVARAAASSYTCPCHRVGLGSPEELVAAAALGALRAGYGWALDAARAILAEEAI